MRKGLALITAIVVLLVFVGKLGFREYNLRSDQAKIENLLATNGSRFQHVRIYRSKSDYNLLEGEVPSSNDVDFLEKELVRLGIRRCIFAVRISDEKISNKVTP